MNSSISFSVDRAGRQQQDLKIPIRQLNGQLDLHIIFAQIRVHDQTAIYSLVSQQHRGQPPTVNEAFALLSQLCQHFCRVWNAPDHMRVVLDLGNWKGRLPAGAASSDIFLQGIHSGQPKPGITYVFSGSDDIH
eukprot:scaffold93322_cov25-Attheya_sp.AAC.1